MINDNGDDDDAIDKERKIKSSNTLCTNLKLTNKKKKKR